MVDVLNMLRQGGWIMFPLGLCSLIAVAVILERTIALRRHRVINARLLKIIREYRGEESAESALIACQRAPGALSEVFAEIIRARDLDHVQATENMHAAGRSQMGELERGLTVLEIIAGISPLLGLLGTVLGMVTVFNAITAQGLGNPQVLSDGISKALITTVAGLSVAIPALAAHSLFSKRVDSLSSEIQGHATRLIIKIQNSA
jgi:biopolymer transport protein ExbB